MHGHSPQHDAMNVKGWTCIDKCSSKNLGSKLETATKVKDNDSRQRNNSDKVRVSIICPMNKCKTQQHNLGKVFKVFLTNISRLVYIICTL